MPLPFGQGNVNEKRQFLCHTFRWGVKFHATLPWSLCLRSDIHKNSTCATALSNRLAFIKYSNTCSVMYNSLRLEVNVSGNSAAHQRNKLKHVCSVNAAISAVFHHYAGIIRWKTAPKWSAVSAMFNRINTSGNNVQVWVDVIRSMSIEWHIFRADML